MRGEATTFEEQIEQLVEELAFSAKKISKKEFYQQIDAFYEKTVDEEKLARLDENDQSVWRLDFGGKTLFVVIDDFDQTVNLYTFHTHVITRKNAGKITNETEMVYRAAKKIMEQFAQSNQAKVKYKFDTHNKAMVAWCVSKGDKIFSWQRGSMDLRKNHRSLTPDAAMAEIEKGNDNDRFEAHCETTFKPSIS